MLSILDKIRTSRQPDRFLTDLLVLLQQCRDLECSDPRDNIYAILSLIDVPGLVADYSLTTKGLYAALCRVVLAAGHLSLLLSLRNGGTRCADPDLDLPSWMPDWGRVENVFAHSDLTNVDDAGIADDDTMVCQVERGVH